MNAVIPSLRSDPDVLVKRVQGLCAQGRALDALALCEDAHAVHPGDAGLRSLLGVLLAEQRGLCRRATELCTAAVAQEPTAGEHHARLVRVHVVAGDKAAAVSAVRAGLASCPEHVELGHLLQMLGARRKPFFGALPRSHPLNRWVGMLTWRLGFR